MNARYSIAIHGGAGTILRSDLTPEKEQAYREALLAAVEAGATILKQSGSAMDAVEAAVRSLEDCSLFNAGKGSVFTNEGTHEMDASIMDGRTLEAGAVGMVKGIRNPITLARKVMDDSKHVLLCGAGAEQFGREMGVAFADSDYFYDEARFQQWQGVLQANQVALDHNSNKFGTVGAVACDHAGNLAAATSTGGLTNKKYGRVGDSPLIGAGTYANNATCAISATGYGEFFMRGVVAYDVSALMEYKGLSLEAACRKVILEKQVALGGEGGVIGVDTFGNIALIFNSEGMYRAWAQEGEDVGWGIW
ncbi:MAG: isoaspartyl peptidase/L-asparaginase [Saprospirales bacterium]|nr:isoaspartyl peptidase/L-asparaginase [Saprospirales bacterium]